MDYHRSDTAKKRSKPYTHLTAIQKKEICQRQRDNPNILSYRNLANEYGVGKSTIQDIIFQSKKWLAIDINETSTYCLKNKPLFSIKTVYLFCATLNRLFVQPR